MSFALTDTTHMVDIKNATLQECKDVIDSLVERVSELIGCAPELEDASCELQLAIDVEDREN